MGVIMKRSIIAAVAAATMLAACNQGGDKAAGEVKLESESAKMSYAIGLDIGQSLKGLGAEIDMQAFTAAVNDRLNDRPQRLDAKEAGEVLQAFFKKRAEAQEAKRLAEAEANKKAGEQFLAENGKKEGVKTTASGLQYEVLTEGTGATPKETDKVTVNYRGTLIDGKEFDSSYKRGQPATFPVNGVIKGWTEALQLMKIGGKYRLFIPSELGYGVRGAGNVIGPNSALIFEVELLNVEAGQAGEEKKG